MATSEGIKQRAVEKPPSTDTGVTDGAGAGASSLTSKDRKIARAKRRLPTLIAALAIPIVLSAVSACLSGTMHPGRPDTKSSLQLPITAFHLGNIITAALTSLSAWLFWAKGGFHSQPTGLLLYLGSLILGLAWGPVVLRLQNARLGLAVVASMSVCLFGCSRLFRRVNPASGDLIVPCLAWALFLAMFTYRLM